MTINVQRISLTHEKLHFLHYSVREAIYELIDVVGYFSVILQPGNFCKVDLTYVCSTARTARKITKYFDLSAFN